MEWRPEATERGPSASIDAADRGGQTTLEMLRGLASACGLYPAALCSVLCLALLGARWMVAGHFAYRFLLWNLFLAWLPWLFGAALSRAPSHRGRGHRLLPHFGAWLLFLPNAPYLVTDLLHLKERPGIPLWFDAALLFAFGWTGCLLGFLSLTVVHARIDAWLGKLAGWSFVLAVSLLTGFGIYLGRFLRWNSWDVLVRPHGLFSDVLCRLANPSGHPRTAAVTLLFAAFFVAAYTAFSQMRGNALAPRR